MRLKSILKILPLFAITMAAPQAQAMITVWATGALNDGTTSYTVSNTTTSTGLGFGGGLLLDLHLERGIALETGGLYLTNKFSDSASSTSTTTGSIYVPADLRIHIVGPLSLSGGLYYDDFLSSGYDTDDGWEAGARLTLHPGIFIDARYLHGLKDQGGGVEYTSILGLVGIRIF